MSEAYRKCLGKNSSLSFVDGIVRLLLGSSLSPLPRRFHRRSSSTEYFVSEETLLFPFHWFLSRRQSWPNQQRPADSMQYHHSTPYGNTTIFIGGGGAGGGASPHHRLHQHPGMDPNYANNNLDLGTFLQAVMGQLAGGLVGVGGPTLPSYVILRLSFVRCLSLSLLIVWCTIWVLEDTWIQWISTRFSPR